MAFFKKRITVGEYGAGLVVTCKQEIDGITSRCLGMRYDNWFDDKDETIGWTDFLLQQGETRDDLLYYFRLTSHGVIQASLLGRDVVTRRGIVEGAIDALEQLVPSYDFLSTFNDLEKAFRGNYEYNDGLLEAHQSDGILNYFPEPYNRCGIELSRYIAKKLNEETQIGANILGDFASFSTCISSSVSTAVRANDFLAKKFKI